MAWRIENGISNLLLFFAFDMSFDPWRNLISFREMRLRYVPAGKRERKRERERERESQHSFPRIERSIFDRKATAAYKGMSGPKMSRVTSQKDRARSNYIISRWRAMFFKLRRGYFSADGQIFYSERLLEMENIKRILFRSKRARN